MDVEGWRDLAAVREREWTRGVVEGARARILEGTTAAGGGGERMVGVGGKRRGMGMGMGRLLVEAWGVLGGLAEGRSGLVDF